MLYDKDVADAIGLRNEDGWIGAFTRSAAPGAIPSGVRVVKVRSEPGDFNKLGARGMILGSITAQGLLCYFIEWDDAPRRAVAVIGWKLAREDGKK